MMKGAAPNYSILNVSTGLGAGRAPDLHSAAVQCGRPS